MQLVVETAVGDIWWDAKINKMVNLYTPAGCTYFWVLNHTKSTPLIFLDTISNNAMPQWAKEEGAQSNICTGSKL